MRVITGTKRGRRLKTPEGLDVRPTTDKVKESIFSIVQFAVPGAVVLDLFAGTGQLGIEALSRGASKCLFVEKAMKTAILTEENVNLCGFGDKSAIKRTDAASFLKNCPYWFDIAFLDPPYDSNLLADCLPLLASHMSDNGIVIAEHDGSFIPDESYGELRLVKQYRYGQIYLSKFVFGGEDGGDIGEDEDGEFDSGEGEI
ncbi:MAG: 16S rRNA (guanine(966)-N(2))-methyltransferase RsmD [Ruminococcus sp.]|jgi:16S rRNA (guanine(966)-N(2))-methyltransferase RsmD|nr:16S rRNA (guanine(966)-N(2))-methyltransferase RsmD [Ruminococcus sp.]